MTIKWGDPIECNGVRPDWLRDGERLQWAHSLNASALWTETLSDELNFAMGKPHQISHIRVRGDHPAYVALAHGFHPWSGGDSAPDDWDGAPALLANGRERVPCWWDRSGPSEFEVIGYRKRVEYGAVRTDGSRSGGQPPRRFVNAPNLTEAEVRALVGGYDAAHRMVEALRERGQLRSETAAERFTRETGHAVTEAVEAALNWKGE